MPSFCSRRLRALSAFSTLFSWTFTIKPGSLLCGSLAHPFTPPSPAGRLWASHQFLLDTPLLTTRQISCPGIESEGLSHAWRKEFTSRSASVRVQSTSVARIRARSCRVIVPTHPPFQPVASTASEGILPADLGAPSSARSHTYLLLPVILSAPKG